PHLDVDPHDARPQSLGGRGERLGQCLGRRWTLRLRRDRGGGRRSGDDGRGGGRRPGESARDARTQRDGADDDQSPLPEPQPLARVLAFHAWQTVDRRRFFQRDRVLRARPDQRLVPMLPMVMLGPNRNDQWLAVSIGPFALVWYV